MDTNLTPYFTIITTLTQQDCRKFLYIATFRQSNTAPLFILGVSVVGTALISWINHWTNPLGIALCWLSLAAVSLGSICWQVERNNKLRIQSDDALVGLPVTIELYDHHLTVQDPRLDGAGTLPYSQFRRLLETKDYFILYHVSNAASVICKRDLDDPAALTAFFKEHFSGHYRSI